MYALYAWWFECQHQDNDTIRLDTANYAHRACRFDSLEDRTGSWCRWRVSSGPASVMRGVRSLSRWGARHGTASGQHGNAARVLRHLFCRRRHNVLVVGRRAELPNEGGCIIWFPARPALLLAGTSDLLGNLDDEGAQRPSKLLIPLWAGPRPESMTHIVPRLQWSKAIHVRPVELRGLPHRFAMLSHIKLGIVCRSVDAFVGPLRLVRSPEFFLLPDLQLQLKNLS